VARHVAGGGSFQGFRAPPLAAERRTYNPRCVFSRPKAIAMNPVPVIAIDGPSASGKGTVAQRVAARLGYRYLDSGAIYRAAAVAATRAGIGLDNLPACEAALAACAAGMKLRFDGDRVWLDGTDISAAVRLEAGGRDASRIAALPALRAALLKRQRDFRVMPGLVADGRDMASVVFPDAALKVFLTADVAERARRRTAQLSPATGLPKSPKGLMEKENNATIRAPFDAVLADLADRDRRDAVRSAAPLLQVAGARLLDTSAMSIDTAVDTVLAWYRDAVDGGSGGK